MTYLAKKHEELERRIVASYSLLNIEFCRLIEEVRQNPKFPENAEELLYKISGRSPIVTKKEFEEKFFLTKKGIRHTIKERHLNKEKPILTTKTIDAIELIGDKTGTEAFETVCMNLQKIIDKYDVEINWKNYEGKIYI